MATKTETIKLSPAASDTFTKIRTAGATGLAVETLDGRTLRSLTSNKLVAKVGGSRVKLSKAGEKYAAIMASSATASI